MLPHAPEYFVAKLKELQHSIRDYVAQQVHQFSVEHLSLAHEREGDTAFAVDLTSEDLLFDFCEKWAEEMPLALVAEGIEESGWQCFPSSASVEEARFVLIVDPIDGSREIMHDKRSAWVLSAIAPNKGEETSLSDIVVAMQTEIPTSKQYLADTLWAVKVKGGQVKGGQVKGERHNILTGEVETFVPQPSQANSLRYGFASISNFFHTGKRITAELQEELFRRLLGEEKNPLAFDDQYISTGGQLYELMMGHDRFNADLRPLVYRAMAWKDDEIPLCAHPYDLCTELIARTAGVIVTDEKGQPLTARLDIRQNLCWIGYANETIRQQIEPVLQELISEAVCAMGSKMSKATGNESAVGS